MKVTLKTFHIVEEEREIEIDDKFKTENPLYFFKEREGKELSVEEANSYFPKLEAFENAILAKVDDTVEFCGDEADIFNGHNFIASVENEEGETIWEF